MRNALAIVLCVCCALLSGCDKKETPAPQPIAIVYGIQQSEVTFRGLPTYVMTLSLNISHGRILKVESRSKPWSYLPNVEYVDSIKQADGQWVIFDCENIAERIIQPELISEIAPDCVSMHSQADQFWKATGYSPSEFVDEQGIHWIRKEIKP